MITLTLFSQTDLKLCSHHRSHNCKAWEAAGVVCDNREMTVVPLACTNRTICLLPGQGDRGNVFYNGRSETILVVFNIILLNNIK